MNLDLSLLPLVRQAGMDRQTLPGLYAAIPPRRVARGRNDDRLILYLNLAGNYPLEDDQHNQLFVRLSQTYYQTPGAVTSAMRIVVEAMNQFLLDRNLRSRGEARQGMGLFILAVVRQNRLYLALCGPVHVYLVAARGTQEFFDTDSAGRGLGLSRMAPMRYFQADLNPNEFLLFAPQPPAAWSTALLQVSGSIGLEGLRRRLLGQAGPDLNAVLVQLQAGQGKMRLLWPRAGAAPASTPEPPAAQPASVVTLPENASVLPVPQEPLEEPPPLPAEPASIDQPAVGEPVAAEPVEPLPQAGDDAPASTDAEIVSDPLVSEPELQTLAGDLQPGIEPAPVNVSAQPVPVQDPPSVRWLNQGQPMPARPAAQRTAPGSVPASPDTSASKASPRRVSAPKVSAAPLLKVLAAIWAAVSSAWRITGGALRSLIRRILPDETLFNIPSSTMIFFAVAVPLVIAVIGSMVYIERGRAEQYNVYYDQALAFAATAMAETDPTGQRVAWLNALNNIEKARSYQKTTDSQDLRNKAQKALDQLDGVQRLAFLDAVAGVGGLSKSLQIVRMVATTDELYLLDGQHGIVKRAFLTGQGYDIDPNFICGPGTFSAQLTVGKLVDIVALPKGNENKATLLGMDGSGNLLYCIPGEKPLAQSLKSPPSGWKSPSAFALDTENLYVLDAPAQAVWVYRYMEVLEQPILAFDEYVPQNMANVVDFAVEQGEIFLLHEDSQLTHCTYSLYEQVPTRCKDPASYTDTRPGRQSGSLIQGTRFESLVYVPSPENSLFMFDGIEYAIYRFGMQLTLYNQYRPGEPLAADPATAFTISPNRVVFIAVGNLIYYTGLP